MGLDQYAYSAEQKDDPEYIWRKHAKLQSFMEERYYEREGNDADSFNCVELALTTEDIQTFEILVETNNLPESEGGLFFGHQFQDASAEEYKEQDLKFCKWAHAILATREQVFYSCWW